MIDPLALVTALWQPANFFLGRGLRCAWQFEAEQILPWELFRGRLLDPRQTRETKRFLTWNILPVENGRVGEHPLLSLLFDETAREIFVTRGLLCRVWKPVDSAEGIAGEEAVEWIRELVGSTSLTDIDPNKNSIDELQCLLRHAVGGTSRLPLSSVEAPLPQFTFGQFAYAPSDAFGDSRQPMRSWRDLSRRFDESSNDAKLLEAILRSAPDEDLSEIAQWFAKRHDASELWLRMFNDISLSPYTDFVDRALDVLEILPNEIDVLARLLIRLTRHLTAYDLVLFHYRGANYPDALLLDALTRRLLSRCDTPAMTDGSPAGKRRRRAIRMGCLLRLHYEGHAVPDQPTSPGENARVLPEAYRVPDEQIEQPARRQRQLFVDAPLAKLIDDSARAVLAQSLGDLDADAELRELGTALFIDRPLGYFKAPAEVDQTPLLSYVAFSRRLATSRLHELERLAKTLNVPWTPPLQRVAAITAKGVSLDRIPESRRPAVSLADARKVSDDFVFLNTTPSSRRAFWESLGVETKDWPLVIRVMNAEAKPVMAAIDGDACREFDADWSRGGVVRKGVETPHAGIAWV